MQTTRYSNDPGPSRVAEARDAVAYLKARGYDQLLKAIADTTTADGRINKSAVARHLKISPDAVREQLREMQALLE